MFFSCQLLRWHCKNNSLLDYCFYIVVSHYFCWEFTSKPRLRVFDPVLSNISNEDYCTPFRDKKFVRNIKTNDLDKSTQTSTNFSVGVIIVYIVLAYLTTKKARTFVRGA